MYKKLESLAVGFDTPASVIEKLVALHGNIEGADNKWTEIEVSKKPQLIFYPDDEDDFIKLLVKNKKAFVKIYLKDSSSMIHEWTANKIKLSSNLRANIWSGYLRNWKNLEISKAEFAINRDCLEG